MSRVIAGDIGGSKTRLVIVEVASNVPARGRPMGSPLLRIERESTYPSRDFASFDALLTAFLDGMQAPPPYAAFGIAGPVLGNATRTTNLPWYIESDVLCRHFGFKVCSLLNDLEATAYGLPALRSEDLLTLQRGEPDANGNAAIIAAGTGLGEAGMYWDGQRHHPYAIEGGHASFSPQSELEISLLQYLQLRHEHVSWERVVSGMGLVDIHDFLRAYRKVALPQWQADEMRENDAAAVISQAALDGKDDICVEVLDLFVHLYGAEAGNLALKTMSRGGLYVGGGIAPKILPAFQHGIFMQSFLNKGRMRSLLESMPVHVILDDRTALYGAALYAAS